MPTKVDRKSKYIGIKLHFLKDKVNEGVTNIRYHPNNHQIANMSTTSGILLYDFLSKQNIIECHVYIIYSLVNYQLQII